MRHVSKSLALLKPQLTLALLVLLAFGLATPPGASLNHDLLLGQSSTATKQEAEIAKARTIVLEFANGNYEKVRTFLNESLQAEWSADKLKGIWEELIETTSNVTDIRETKLIVSFGGNLVYVCTSFEEYSPSCSETSTNFVVTFNQDNEVIGIDFPKVESIETIAEKFINDLGKGDFAAARGYYHPYLKEDIFPGQVQETWEERERALGEFQELDTITNRPGSTADGITIIEVSIVFEKGVANAIIIFDDDKRITGIDFF